MQTLSRTLPLTCILALAAPLAVAADDPKNDEHSFYVEGLLGSAAYDFNADINNDFTTLGVRGGYNLNKYFAIEGEYLAGTNTHNDSLAYTLPFPEEDTLFRSDRSNELNAIYGLFAKANAPINDRFAVHARAGYATVESSSSNQITTVETGETRDFSSDNQDNAFALGIGGTFNISDKLYARADVTRIDVQIEDVESVTIGLGVKF